MAYVNVPKDLTKVKTKVLFNLTKRQLICFGSGALIGVPLFFLLKGSIGTSPAAMRPATYADTGCCPAPIFLSYPFGSLLRWRLRSVFVRRGSAFSFRTI